MKKNASMRLLVWCFLGLLFPEHSFAQSQQCISDPQFANVNTGVSIVTAIFGNGGSNPGVINSILNQVSSTFYNNLVNSSGFHGVVLAMLTLYITIYGIMVMFGLIQVSANDVVNRLFKIGIIWGMVFPFGHYTSGWQFFYQWIGGFFMGGMNALITEFAQAGVAGGLSPVIIQPGVAVNPGVVQSLIGPIGQVFSAKFITIIMSLFSVQGMGPIMAFFVIWALIDFIFMVIGAMATYMKSVVGLAFLFGIAPIFIIFLLFDKSRQIFWGWLNQVVSFTLTPILLFAFLSFYCQLISGILQGLLYQNPAATSTATNYCWSHWFSIPGLWDFWWWLPKYPNQVNAGGSCVDPTNNNFPCMPVQIVDILYFLLLCHLGKEFCKFIDTISQDFSNATSPGVVQGSTVSNWASKNLMGGHSMGWVAGGLTLGAGGAYAYMKNKMQGVSGGQVRPSIGGSSTTRGGAGGAAGPNALANARTLTGIRPAISTYMYRVAQPNKTAQDYSDTLSQADTNIQTALTKQDASGQTLLDKYNSAPKGSAQAQAASNDIKAVIRSGIQDAATSKNFNLDNNQLDQMADNVSKQVLPPK